MAMGRTDAMGEDHLAEVSATQSFSLAVKSYMFVLSPGSSVSHRPVIQHGSSNVQGSAG